MVDNKEIVSRINQATGIEKVRLQRMMHGLVQVIVQQSKNLNTVSFGKLGEVVVRKRMEFVYLNRKTGQQILYPPRLAARFKAGKIEKE